MASAVSGYAVIVCNVGYTMLSIPLALHYLTREQFGLWALVAQLTGYLALLDLGMSGSVSRLLIDHKDDRNGGTLGGLIKTAWCVCVIQAVIIFLTTLIFALFGGGLMKINPALQSEFSEIMLFQGALAGLGFCTRIFHQLLYANQRLDIINWTGAVQFAVALATLWTGFALGQGIFSMVLATAAGFIFSLSCFAFFSLRLRLFPDSGHWGASTLEQFMEMFKYGANMFLISLGIQMVMSSQTVLITRSLGLDASAIWSVCTKAFTLCTMFVWKVFDVSAPMLSEMIVREETETLKRRYAQVVQTTFAITTLGAIALAVANRAFVSVWTSGKISWDWWNDALLGVWLLVITYNHCHASLVIWTKDIRSLKYIYFVEGVVFIASGYLASKMFGITGVLLASIVSGALFSGLYSVWRAGSILSLTQFDLGWKWFRRSAFMAAVVLPFGIVAVVVAPHVTPWTSLILASGALLFVGGFALLRIGLPPEVVVEMLSRFPLPARKWLAWLTPNMRQSGYRK